MKPHEFQDARRALGMTQLELGNALEIASGKRDSAERAIRRYETGTTAIPGPLAVAVRLMLKGRRKRAPKS